MNQMMLYPAANPSASRSSSGPSGKHTKPQLHQQPLPVKRRRGRPPKDQTAENSPSSISDGIFTTSPLALNSAAALRLGSPETTSPLMRVSPDKRKRGSFDKLGQSAKGPKGKRSKSSSFVEYTPTRPSPLSSKRQDAVVMLPPPSKTHQKLNEVTGRKVQQLVQSKMDPQAANQDSKFARPAVNAAQLITLNITPNPNRFQMDPNLLLSSPLLNLQQPSSFVKQHGEDGISTQDIIFGHGNIPLTPASQFSSMIHSSPIYQTYFGELQTPLIARKFNFDTSFSKINFDEEDLLLAQQPQQQQSLHPLANQLRSNSLTVIDTIGRNISHGHNSDPPFPPSSDHFIHPASSPPVPRPQESIKKSYSTLSLPLSRPLRQLPLRNKNFKISLKIGSDGKASISKEEEENEASHRVRLVTGQEQEQIQSIGVTSSSHILQQQPSIKITPRLTIRPSLMTLSSSPLLMSRDSTINNLKSIILHDAEADDDDSEYGEEEDDLVISKTESDARNALMRAFKRMV